MDEEEPFLRALLANPHDRVTRQVYADWLADRNDPRAEFLHLHARLAAAGSGHPERPGLRQRINQLRALLPSWWLDHVG
ncbi:TIGR02996 domain-containing protein [Frigoriglobus tundricola]|nr:TIGR02996 domain-containing protein [Frigoriglobus tundricola]